VPQGLGLCCSFFALMFRARGDFPGAFTQLQRFESWNDGDCLCWTEFSHQPQPGSARGGRTSNRQGQRRGRRSGSRGTGRCFPGGSRARRSELAEEGALQQAKGEPGQMSG
jgi:hypothetical protein